MRFDNEKNKWDRQSEEPKSAFKYFSFFLIEQAKNSKDPLQKTADYFDRKIKYISQISYVYQWASRAEAYNQHLAEEQQKEFEREYKKICKETIMQIGAMSQIIGQKINADIMSLKDAKGDKEAIKEAIGNMPLNQVAQVLKTNQDILKTILRIPDSQEVTVSGKVATTIKEDDMTDKLSKLSPEKREEYLALQAELNDEPAD